MPLWQPPWQPAPPACGVDASPLPCLLRLHMKHAHICVPPQRVRTHGAACQAPIPHVLGPPGTCPVRTIAGSRSALHTSCSQPSFESRGILAGRCFGLIYCACTARHAFSLSASWDGAQCTQLHSWARVQDGLQSVTNHLWPLHARAGCTGSRVAAALPGQTWHLPPAAAPAPWAPKWGPTEAHPVTHDSVGEICRLYWQDYDQGRNGISMTALLLPGQSAASVLSGSPGSCRGWRHVLLPSLSRCMCQLLHRSCSCRNFSAQHKFLTCRLRSRIAFCRDHTRCLAHALSGHGPL